MDYCELKCQAQSKSSDFKAGQRVRFCHPKINFECESVIVKLVTASTAFLHPQQLMDFTTNNPEPGIAKFADQSN